MLSGDSKQETIFSFGRIAVGFGILYWMQVEAHGCVTAKLLYEWFQALAVVKKNAPTTQHTRPVAPSKVTENDVLRLPSLR